MIDAVNYFVLAWKDITAKTIKKWLITSGFQTVVFNEVGRQDHEFKERNAICELGVTFPEYLNIDEHFESTE